MSSQGRNWEQDYFSILTWRAHVFIFFNIRKGNEEQVTWTYNGLLTMITYMFRRLIYVFRFLLLSLKKDLDMKVMRRVIMLNT